MEWFSHSSHWKWEMTDNWNALIQNLQVKSRPTVRTRGSKLRIHSVSQNIILQVVKGTRESWCAFEQKTCPWDTDAVSSVCEWLMFLMNRCDVLTATRVCVDVKALWVVKNVQKSTIWYRTFTRLLKILIMSVLFIFSHVLVQIKRLNYWQVGNIKTDFIC